MTPVGVITMLEATIKQKEPMTVAVLPMRGPYAQVPEGYGRLYGWIAQHGLQPAGMPEAVYFTSPAEVPESEAVWELWAPIAGDAEIPPDESGIGTRLVPATTMASAMHKGPYDTIESTYAALAGWVAQQGYRLAGPPHEAYYSDPNDVPPEETLTEILFPVEKL